MTDNNNIYLSGKVVEFAESFTCRDTNFYKAILMVERLSGEADYLPIIIPERLFSELGGLFGRDIGVSGEIRSYNRQESKTNKCLVATFAKKIDILEAPCYSNQVLIEGFLCRKPLFRRTPFGKHISELCIAVSRKYGATSYINCIAWGRLAIESALLDVGQKVKVTGRMQSRNYNKQLEDNSKELRTAYELSIFNMEVLNESSKRRD